MIYAHTARKIIKQRSKGVAHGVIAKRYGIKITDVNAVVTQHIDTGYNCFPISENDNLSLADLFLRGKM